jgi:PEP-CTERM motif
MSFRQFISLIGILAVCLSAPGRASANRIEANSVQQVFSPNQNISTLHIGRVSNHYFPVVDFEIPTARESQPRAPKVNFESESLLSGVSFYALSQDPQKAPKGTVDVTICDCGDVIVPIAGGGFPKWPLLFLAGIPFLFIDGGNPDVIIPPTLVITPTSVTPTSLPTPTPSEIPEPASLLLFFTGVCAVGLRLRKSLARNRE